MSGVTEVRNGRMGNAFIGNARIVTDATDVNSGIRCIRNATCDRCGRAIATDDPTFGIELKSAARGYFTGRVCRDCAGAHQLLVRTQEWDGDFKVHEWRFKSCSVCGAAVYLKVEWHENSRGGRYWVHDPWTRYRHLDRLVCSQACRREQLRRDRAIVREAERPRPRPCAVCGERFRPHDHRAIYCSAACKQKAYRMRQREAPR